MYTENMKKTKNKFMFFMIIMTVLMSVFGVYGQSDRQTVYVISIDGEITPAMAAFLEDKLEDANAAGADGIVIEMKTFGGRVDSATEMRDAIFDSSIPVVVYIESRAISAGALISIAADTLIMAPGSHIGAAQPIPNDPKTVAFVSGEFRTTAEKTGRDPQIAMAMVDAAIEIEGIVREGEILDLTANEALEYGFADHIVSDLDEVLEVMGWQNAEVIEEEPDFRYRIAQFLSSYEVASLLLSLGTIALIAEFYTQGFGISGIIGITCFVLYFSSGFIAGYTELWSIVIFLAGVILLFIELTIPGFGVFGISGIIAVFLGIIFAAPSVRQGVISLLIAVIAGVLAVPIFLKVFGKTKLMQRLVLNTSETVDRGYVHSPDKNYLLGKTGKTQTGLRPSGSILIDGLRIDALADGMFIDSNTSVKVIRVEGSKVVVTPDSE